MGARAHGIHLAGWEAATSPGRLLTAAIYESIQTSLTGPLCSFCIFIHSLGLWEVAALVVGCPTDNVLWHRTKLRSQSHEGDQGWFGTYNADGENLWRARSLIVDTTAQRIVITSPEEHSALVEGRTDSQTSRTTCWPLMFGSHWVSAGSATVGFLQLQLCGTWLTLLGCARCWVPRGDEGGAAPDVGCCGSIRKCDVRSQLRKV